MKRLYKYVSPVTYCRKLLEIIRKRKLFNSFKTIGSLQIDLLNYTIISPQFINIGHDVFMGPGIYISAEVNIGDRVMFGPQCMIIGGDHLFGRVGEYTRNIKPKNRENIIKITIEEDVWCGARVTILKGVRIGMGAVIGAGSVVVKDLPPYSVSVGNPCKVVSKIFNDDELSMHLNLLGYSTEDIQNIIEKRNKWFKS